MKNTQLIAFLLIFIPIFQLRAQNYPFGEATIKLKSGDSLKCFVELAPTYFNKVYYRKELNGEDLELNTKQVKSIRTQYSFWENISYGKKEDLMNLVVDGKIKLYAFAILNEGPKQDLGIANYSFYSPKVTYVIKHGSQFTELKKKTFVDSLGKILSECNSVVTDLKNKVYKYEEVDKVIEKYNNCK